MGVEPGYGTLNWMTLHASNTPKLRPEGFTGMRAVTIKEVRQHCTEDDAWMVFRGTVYNVTPYLKFHPGGLEELMRAAGSDGTRLFDAVHPWVNVESMLANCRIGTLAASAPSTSLSSRSLLPPVPSFGTVAQSPLRSSSSALATSSSETNASLFSPLSSDFKPCALIASKRLCQDVLAGDGSGRGSCLWVQRYLYVASDSPAAGQGATSGKSETSRFTVMHAAREEASKTVAPASSSSSNSPVLAPWVPLGFHFRVRAVINRQIVIREYTVTACGRGSGTLAPGAEGKQDAHWFDVALKTYSPAGMLSSMMTSLPLRSSDMTFKGPGGDFNLPEELRGVKALGIVAAGSGVTPFFRVIEYWLSCAPAENVYTSSPSASPRPVTRSLALLVVDRAPDMHMLTPAHTRAYCLAAHDPSLPIPLAEHFLWGDDEESKHGRSRIVEGGNKGVEPPFARGPVDMKAAFLLSDSQAACTHNEEGKQDNPSASTAKFSDSSYVSLLHGRLSPVILASTLPPPFEPAFQQDKNFSVWTSEVQCFSC